jgi:hypothetical protein
MYFKGYFVVEVNTYCYNRFQHILPPIPHLFASTADLFECIKNTLTVKYVYTVSPAEQ